KSKYWSPKNGSIVPRDILKSSRHIKYIFDCGICGHEFSSTILSIITSKLCAYCVNRKFCDDDCELCFLKSFASHEKSKYWSKENGDIKAKNVFIRSSTKYKFNCDCGNFYVISSDRIVERYWLGYCYTTSL